MSKLAEETVHLPLAERSGAAINEMIRPSGGDARTVVSALRPEPGIDPEEADAGVSVGYVRRRPTR